MRAANQQLQVREFQHEGTKFACALRRRPVTILLTPVQRRINVTSIPGTCVPFETNDPFAAVGFPYCRSFKGKQSRIATGNIALDCLMRRFPS
jgi:hypothetical protein